MSAIGIDFDVTRVTTASRARSGWWIAQVETALYRDLRDVLNHAFQRGVTHAALERPWLKRWKDKVTGEHKDAPQAHAQLWRVYGRIEVLCEQVGLVVVAMPPSEWQAAMLTPQHGQLGDSKNRKKLSLIVAKELGAEVEKNHHKADAVCMAELLSKRLRLERAEV